MTISKTPPEVEERIRRFVLEEIVPEGTTVALTPATRLLDEGVLDSAGIFHLISFLEDEYGVQVPDEALTVENFATIQDIARLVG